MSGSELLVVLVAALLLFGGKRLPEFARTAGKILRDFRRAWNEMKRQVGLDFDDINPDITRTPPLVGGDTDPKKTQDESDREPQEKSDKG